MIFESLADLKTSVKEAVYTLKSAWKKLASLGANSGRAFRLVDGETISFPTEEEVIITAPAKTLRGQNVQLMHLSAKREAGFGMVPMWVFRKKTRLVDEESSTIRDHKLYQSLLAASNDLERVMLLCGRTFTVREEVVATTDKDGKEYDIHIYLLDEPKSPKGKGGKSSK